MKDRTRLVKEIIELQRQVRRALRGYVPDAWMNLNLTIPQLKSLFLIAREGSMNTKSLAKELRVTPSNITGIIDRLVRQGLVSRQENPEDRRMLELRITDKGETLLTSLREETISSMYEVLSRMNTEELSSLARGLASLAKAAEGHRGESRHEHD